MRIRLLALDYDGTLARHGLVEPATWQALSKFRQRYGKLVLVTGREVSELKEVCTRLDLFDRVVAENGAVLWDPASGRMELLAQPPPPLLIDQLRQCEIYPLAIGSVIVATLILHQQKVHKVLNGLQLPWRAIPNKESLMLLPQGTDKATGLERALAELEVRWSEVAGAGDAENDLVFLSRCGHAVALANSLQEIKNTAHSVMSKPDGAGVVEFIEMLENRLDASTDAKT